MEPDNPFALGNRAAPANEPPNARAPTGRAYTPEEQKEQLKGFVLLKPKLYRYIDARTQVRYYTTDKARNDGFRLGGFVKNLFPAKDDGTAGPGMYLTPAGDLGGRGWPVYFENVDKIYVKTNLSWHLARQSAVSHTDLAQITAAVNERFAQLSQQVMALDARLQRIERG